MQKGLQREVYIHEIYVSNFLTLRGGPEMFSRGCFGNSLPFTNEIVGS